MRLGPNIAVPAALIGDPARAAMLNALLDGSARPAGALASLAGLSAQAASNHLARLVEGGLLAVEREGRHRYYRLAGARVAAALEALAGLAPPVPPLREPRSRLARELRLARSCYDHLAGRLGVAVTRALEERGVLADTTDAPVEAKLYAVTKDGTRWLAELGIEVGAIRPTRRGLARRCLDWTERRHHLAGPLGV